MKMDTSEGPIMGFDVVARLDENFLFLLQFVDSPMKQLTKEKQNLAKKWLVKLSTEADVQCTTEKIKRNSYLTQLIHDLEQGSLKSPFNAPPPQGQLEYIDFNSTWLATGTTPLVDLSMLASKKPEIEWLDKLMRDEAEKVHVGGKNFETYLSTKMFENGRGACAYIAVSALNEGDEASWVKIQPNKKKEDIIDQMFQKEMKNFLDEDE